MELRLKHIIFAVLILAQFASSLKVGENCQTDQECQADLGQLSACPQDELKCRCIQDQSVANRDDSKCLEIRTQLEGDCEENVQCKVTNSECHSTALKCLCKDTHFGSADKTQCIAKRLIGQDCNDVSECRAQANSACVADNTGVKKCTCDDGYYATTGRDQCLIKQDLDGPCSRDIECKLEFSRCLSRQCVCDANHYANDNKTVCLDKKPLNAPCDNNDQCKPTNSLCAGGTCTCDSSFYGSADNQQCLQKKLLQQECTADNQCLAEFSTCLQVGDKKQCTCTDPLVSSDFKERCLTRSGLDLGCTDQSQCSHIPGTICDKMRMLCDCNPFHFRMTVSGVSGCYAKAYLGDLCQVKEQCLVPGSVCNAGKCNCAQGSVANLGRTLCFAEVKMGDNCNDTVQCPSQYGLCLGAGTDKNCTCTGERIFNDDKTDCVLKVEMGGNCTDKVQCTAITPNSVCEATNKTCICDGTHVQVEDDNKAKQCIAKAGLESACELDIQCSAQVQYSVCEEQKCACRKGYGAVDDNSKCSGALNLQAHLGIIFIASFAAGLKLYL